MALKKAGIATPFMLPLLIFTVLFNGYIRQQHFRVAQMLPTRKACHADRKKKEGSLDFSFLDGAYLQEALREKHVIPENLSAARARELGLEDPEATTDIESVCLMAGSMEN